MLRSKDLLKIKNRPVKISDSIDRICHLLKIYNEKHGTYLSYGEFVKKLENDEIRIKE